MPEIDRASVIGQIVVTDAHILEITIQQVTAMEIAGGHFVVPGVDGVYGVIHTHGNILADCKPLVTCRDNTIRWGGAIRAGVRQKIVLGHILAMRHRRIGQSDIYGQGFTFA